MLPLKAPALSSLMLVLNIGTFLPSSIWRTGIPASKSSASNEKEQPIKK
jgi:hypothetical protein